jgi:uncharacterized protein (DUF427 family)
MVDTAHRGQSTTRGRVRVEQGHKRVRTYLGGRLVADTTRPLLVWESPRYPTYYIPVSDVRAELRPTGQSEHSPSRGDGVVLDVVAASDGRPPTTAPAAARRYPESPIEELRDAVRLDWGAFDEWLEEDEPVYTHARDPYTRVDILHGSRHVQVVVDGVTVADSVRPTLLFETGVVTRYYLPISDVRMELLEPTTSITHCPYKGAASYWSVRIGDRVHEDLVWSYRAPLPESQKITGLVCFYNEKVELIVDGALVIGPGTSS